MSRFSINISDNASYEFNSHEYTETQAIEQALEWFDERAPKIKIYHYPEVIKRWAVVNPDGTFAGVPWESEEGARELAFQKEGRQIFQMELHPNDQIIWD